MDLANKLALLFDATDWLEETGFIAETSQFEANGPPPVWSKASLALDSRLRV